MTSHSESHKVGSFLSDLILGGQDGLVNVLGVTLGVAAASSDSHIVIVAGLAATFAESISMAAVAYTSTKADSEYYQSELNREKREVKEVPHLEKDEVRAIYKKRGFSGKLLEDVVDTITKNEKVWIEVMMRDELNLTKVDHRQALHSSILVGISAFVGSLIPLLAFFVLPIATAIPIAIVFSALSLFAVGFYKARLTVGNVYRSGLELMLIGIISALVGYAIGFILKVPAS